MTDDIEASTVESISYERLSLKFEGGLATLTIDDPDKSNALTPAMALDMVAALTEVAKPRRKARALTITGNGRCFCAGANLSSEAKAVAEGRGKIPSVPAVETAYHPMLRRLHSVTIPVIAAVNGPCVGIGVAIALAADYVLASEAAFFATPFASLASAPDSGLTWLLPQVVGIQAARRMLLRAERIPAPLALDWGLIHQVVPAVDFASTVRAVADDFAQGPTVAFGEMKRLLVDGQRCDLDAAMEAEVRAVARTSRTSDNLAAMKVFGTRDKPRFSGA